jgi:hypothetical protein
MSDSDNTQALAANIRGDGAAVAAAPPHEYPEDMLSSSEEEEEEPTLPMKKRKSAGGARLTRRKKTTRRVSGEQETPSPGRANNLLEGRVNELEEESEELQRQLATAKEGRKQANTRVSLLNKEVKLLKDQLKLTSGEDAVQEI